MYKGLPRVNHNAYAMQRSQGHHVLSQINLVVSIFPSVIPCSFLMVSICDNSLCTSEWPLFRPMSYSFNRPDEKRICECINPFVRNLNSRSQFHQIRCGGKKTYFNREIDIPIVRRTLEFGVSARSAIRHLGRSSWQKFHRNAHKWCIRMQATELRLRAVMFAEK